MLTEPTEDQDAVARCVVRMAQFVRRDLGAGLYESAYERLLEHRLRREGLDVVRQMPIHLRAEELDLGLVGRVDMVVEGVVAVECKAVQKLHPIHEAQLLTYLRLGGYPIGLLLNFHAIPFADGMKRKVNSLAFGAAVKDPGVLAPWRLGVAEPSTPRGD